MSALAFDLIGASSEGKSGSRITEGDLSRQRARAIFLLTLTCWVSNFAILVSRKVIEGDSIWDAAMVRLALAIFGLGLCYIIHASLSLIRPKTFLKRAIAVSILALLAAETYAWASYYAFVAVDPSTARETVNWSLAIYSLAFWTWFFLAWAGLYIALEYSFTVAEEKERSAMLQAQAYAAQLTALHYQINPHFLFNCLNSLSALIFEGRSSDAERMIAGLSDFFRLTLALDPNEEITLEREIELQRGYLLVEQIRYPDLAIEIDIPDELRTAIVPILILQPIVENAVKYGVQSSRPPARITVTARSHHGFLVLEVTDSGRPTERAVSNGTGIGLRNVRERLSQRFGNLQSLVAGRTDEGFSVKISMPLEDARCHS